MIRKIYKSKAIRRLQLLEYFANPDNPFVNRSEMACTALGYKSSKAMYKMFTPAELNEIEVEGLAIRRTKYAPALSKVDAALIKEAQAGDVAACKLCYQRFEGWNPKKEIKGDVGLNLGGDGKIEIVLVDAKAPFADEMEEIDKIEHEAAPPIKLFTKPGDTVK